MPGIISDRTVIEVHPDFFRDPVTQQYQFFVAVGQGPTRQAGIDHAPVELGDFRPAQFNGRPQQIGMPPTGELRVGVVIDHVPGLAPKHHHWQGGREHQLHRAVQASWPRVECAQFGAAPVERTNAPGHFAAPAGTSVAIL
ncbi:hypothetical protein D3C81_1371550 [compost metagenome]